MTKDIPIMIAVGNPCRVLREITEEEKDWRQNNSRTIKRAWKIEQKSKGRPVGRPF